MNTVSVLSASTSWNSYQSPATTHEKDPENRTEESNSAQRLAESTEREVCKGLARLVVVLKVIKMKKGRENMTFKKTKKELDGHLCIASFQMTMEKTQK